jgi:hypothetical protein
VGGLLTVCNGETPEGYDIVRYKMFATHDMRGFKFYAKLLRFTPVECLLLREFMNDWIWSTVTIC